jgi:hypothetical protein
MDRIVLEACASNLPQVFVARGLPGIKLCQDSFVGWMNEHAITGLDAIDALDFFRR